MVSDSLQAIFKGKYADDSFECNYTLRDLRYLPYAIIPHFKMNLEKTSCKNPQARVNHHLQKHVLLQLKRLGNQQECKADLLFTYSSAIDIHPTYDGNAIAQLNQTMHPNRNGKKK